MSKVIASFLCLLMLPTLSHADPQVSRAAAVVNDTVISITDVKNRVRLAILSSGMTESKSLMEELTPQTLDTMIEEALQRQMAKKVGINLEEGDVDYAIQEIEQQNQMPAGQLLSLLKDHGIPAETLRNQVEANTLWRDYIRARYGDFVQITEAQVDRKLEEIKASRDEPQVLLAEITLPVRSPAEESKVLKNIQQLARKAAGGARFSALAQQFSSAASAAKGGDIGWVSENRLDPQLSDAVRQAPTGALTQPVRTSEGYSLLMVRDRRGAGESIDKDTFYTFRQLVFPLSQSPSQEELYNTYTRAQSIAQSAKSCTILDSVVAKRKNLKVQKIEKASSRSMPQELKKLLDGLAIGRASQPVLTPGGALLFMLCEKEEYNPEAPSREGIRMMLKGEELTKIAEKELRNLKTAAFINLLL